MVGSARDTYNFLQYVNIVIFVFFFVSFFPNVILRTFPIGLAWLGLALAKL